MRIGTGWRRGLSLNKLMEVLLVRSLAEHDTEVRFRITTQMPGWQAGPVSRLAHG